VTTTDLACCRQCGAEPDHLRSHPGRGRRLVRGLCARCYSTEWRAAHPDYHTEWRRAHGLAHEPQEAACRHCGETFTTTSKTHLYCSRRCNYAARAERDARAVSTVSAPALISWCKVCDAPFVRTVLGGRRTHCRECRPPKRSVPARDELAALRHRIAAMARPSGRR